VNSRQQPPVGSVDAYVHVGDVSQYPWFPLPDGRVVRFEVRCAICHEGLCQVSNGVKLDNFEIPCVFVGICRTCARRIRSDPAFGPESS